ncbi:hypothetical protein BDQ12DRAFT_720116 [Crucibulum laeve]|uniref:Uncharacterized protein n=1 Tax=Crucibulum laeve TaxID=68775 RepID=A0A5C3M9I0_9AGAR|nr:hypothetical protein BDQ12DRAFT_720116 [Crucibulum laeve]
MANDYDYNYDYDNNNNNNNNYANHDYHLHGNQEGKNGLGERQEDEEAPGAYATHCRPPTCVHSFQSPTSSLAQPHLDDNSYEPVLTTLIDLTSTVYLCIHVSSATTAGSPLTTTTSPCVYARLPISSFSPPVQQGGHHLPVHIPGSHLVIFTTSTTGRPPSPPCAYDWLSVLSFLSPAQQGGHHHLPVRILSSCLINFTTSATRRPPPPPCAYAQLPVSSFLSPAQQGGHHHLPVHMPSSPSHHFCHQHNREATTSLCICLAPHLVIFTTSTTGRPSPPLCVSLAPILSFSPPAQQGGHHHLPVCIPSSCLVIFTTSAAGRPPPPCAYAWLSILSISPPAQQGGHHLLSLCVSPAPAPLHHLHHQRSEEATTTVTSV